jgi:serine/threonine protein kinase
MIPPKHAYACGETRYKRCDEGRGGRIGSGSFGAVYIAVDQLTDDAVAVKRQTIPSEQATRELALYQMLRAWPHHNVQAMRDSFTTSSHPPHLYMVFDFASSTLWDAWQTVLGRRGLLEHKLCSKYMLDIVRGVGHLHDLSMVHADLSMSNLLLGQDNVVKVADFGAAFAASTFLGSTSARTTAYVRAPEMFLEAANLTSSVDSWAVGVVGLSLFSGPNMNSKLLTIIMVLVLYLRFPFPCNDDEKVDGCLSVKAMVMMTMFLV